MPKYILIILCLFLVASETAGADTVHLKNGDRVTGEVLDEGNGRVRIKTSSMGVVSIEKAAVKRVTSDEAKGEESAAPEVIWKREASVGYNTSRGNTETSEFSGNFLINRNHVHVNESTFKGSIYYSEANKKMDAQRWNIMGRYAFSFGPSKKWYNFYKMETDHDRFSNINYRLLPSAGFGYWLFDLDDFKLLAECGVGWEHTNYKDTSKNTDEAVLVPRIYVEKRIFDNTVISEDFMYYPALTRSGEYRLKSESAVTVSMNHHLAARLSLIDEYNSNPESGDTKKNDLRLISSLVYSF